MEKFSFDIPEQNPENNYLNSILSATQLPKSQSIDIEAQEFRLEHLEGQTITHALGNVVVHYGPYTILAHDIQFNKNTKTIEIKHRALLVDQEGTIASAEYTKFSMKDARGVFKKLNVYTQKGETIRAQELIMENQNIEVKSAYYTTCFACNGKKPFWHVRAAEIYHDAAEKKITYKHALFYLWDVPIFYFPYFSQYDVTVKRASGFLMPQFSLSSNFGESIRLPYYWSIAPNMDMTLTPTLYTEENPVLKIQFRHRLSSGTYVGEGSTTKSRQQIQKSPTDLPLRGHFFANGLYDLNNRWRSSFQIRLASDNTYLSRYDIVPNATALINNFHLDHIKNDDTLYMDAYSFHSLQYPTGTYPLSSPLVGPRIDYHKEWNVKPEFGRLFLDVGTASVSRMSDVSSRRISAQFSWEKETLLPFGDILKFLSRLNTDLYAVTYSGMLPADPDENKTKWVSRVLPTVGAQWRFPLFSQGKIFYHVLEPILQFFASPVQNHTMIPNEDSNDVEFDDTNLFSMNRYPGVDRIEDGLRSNFGLHYTIYNDKGYQGSFLFGQSYRFTPSHKDNPAAPSALPQGFSDYVGHMSFSTDFLHLFENFRLGRTDLKLKQNELGAGLNYGLLTFSLSYTYILRDPSSILPEKREEITFNGALRVHKNWQIKGGGTYDLTTGDTISNNLGFSFQNECATLNFTYTKQYIRRLDILPDATYKVSFSLKGLYG